jgi:hypothetical protein
MRGEILMGLFVLTDYAQITTRAGRHSSFRAERPSFGVRVATEALDFHMKPREKNEDRL